MFPIVRPSSLTLETWVSFADTLNLRVIMAKPLGGQQNNSYAIWMWGGLYGAVADALGQGPTLFALFAPEVERWYHVAYTFTDEFDFQVLYIDGVPVASGTVTKTIAYDTQPVLLGRDTEFGAPNSFLQGRIDEAAIYNRALEPWEIAAIYNAGPAGKQSLTGTSPMLSAVLTATNTVLLSWPSDPSEFVLQQNANLNSINWVAPSETVMTNGATRTILVNPPVGNRYFRLFKP